MRSRLFLVSALVALALPGLAATAAAQDYDPGTPVSTGRVTTTTTTATTGSSTTTTTTTGTSPTTAASDPTTTEDIVVQPTVESNETDRCPDEMKQAVCADGTPATRVLSRTGAETATTAILGSSLIVAGALASFAARRRRTASTHR